MSLRDRLRPIFGAVVCAVLFFAFAWLLGPPIRFFGGAMAALTVTPLIAALVSGALCMAIFDSGSLADLGLRLHPGALRNLVSGIIAASLGAALTALPAVWLGCARFVTASVPTAPGGDIATPAAPLVPLLLFCGAAGEEIAFRGFPLQYLMRGYGAWPGILGIGVLFGLVHLGNPGVTPLAALNTAGFGILFGAALLRTRSLWLPIGMHFGWNVTLPFLGVPLSGLTIKVTGHRLIWNAGELWSGGSYGPEAGLPATAVLLVLLVLVWLLPLPPGRASLLEAPDSPPAC